MRAAYEDILHDKTLIEYAERTRYVDELALSLTESQSRDTVVWLVGVGPNAVIGITQLLWGQSAAAYPYIGPNEALLNSLYVIPENWGERVGTHLLQRGIAVLPEGIIRLKVGVLPQNEIGYSFYWKHGFKKIGHTQMVIGETRYGIDFLSYEL